MYLSKYELNPLPCRLISSFYNNIRSAYTSLDLTLREGHEGYHQLAKCPQPVGYKALANRERALQGPSSTSTTGTAALSQSQKNALAAKQKAHAMSLAMKPGQQIPMNAFMMYMSGSQLNIFSINITTSAVLTPITNILTMDSTVFGQLSGGNVDLQMPKLIFVALNLAWLALGLYKMSSMRLLPTTSADFTYKIQWKDMMELSSIPPDSLIPA